jgi:hypothetical protein
MLLLSDILKSILNESLTYYELFQDSSFGRKKRAQGMRVQKLQVTSERDGKAWNFAYKSSPHNNTTGKSWEGRITFLKDATNRENAEDLPCHVDCSCPDYKFRYAYANNRKDASPLGVNSLNKCNNAPPRIMNPQLKNGLCKHLISLKNALHKRLRESTTPSISNKLDETVTKYPQFDIEVDE